MDKVSNESYVERYAREHKLGRFAEKEFTAEVTKAESKKDGDSNEQNTRSKGQKAETDKADRSS